MANGLVKVLTGYQTWTNAQTGAVLMIGSAACWGMGTVMSKAALGVFPPLPLLVTQLTASIAVLWLATLVVRAPYHPALLLHGWPGLLEPGLAYVLGAVGLQLTSASNASVIGTLEPVFVMAIAAVFLREIVRVRAWLLAGMAIAGTIIVSTAYAETGGGAASITGDLLELGAVLAASLYVIFSRKSVFSLHPVPLAASQQTFGLACAITVMAVSSLVQGWQDVSHIQPAQWAFAALTGVVQYAAAFLCYLFALKRLPASRAALFLLLIPVFGFAGSVVFLGESISILQIVGSAMIVAALVLLHQTHARD
ncbi:MAG: DMT family transporter [Pleurocapsa minor GSE-CHR-MK-17-07R]|jgi:drug/metabolite transporter (DMT)-like permease|nr:DMT family transporter [Pleurocapsa minor GSE-CHR-MK 17-07R]